MWHIPNCDMRQKLPFLCHFDFFFVICTRKILRQTKSRGAGYDDIFLSFHCIVWISISFHFLAFLGLHEMEMPVCGSKSSFDTDNSEIESDQSRALLPVSPAFVSIIPQCLLRAFVLLLPNCNHGHCHSPSIGEHRTAEPNTKEEGFIRPSIYISHTMAKKQEVRALSEYTVRASIYCVSVVAYLAAPTEMYTTIFGLFCVCIGRNEIGA